MLGTKRRGWGLWGIATSSKLGGEVLIFRFGEGWWYTSLMEFGDSIQGGAGWFYTVNWCNIATFTMFLWGVNLGRD
jgi:hypothetical protein